MDTFRGLMNMRRKRPNTIPPGLVPRMPTAPYQGMEPTATLNSAAMPKKKGFFGKMSPEELKDFKDTMAEMDFGVDQEFLTRASPSPPTPGSFKPIAFDQTAELKKRREQMQSLFPFITA